MKRKLWHKSRDKDWHEVELHLTDALHALRVDPEHWRTENPLAETSKQIGSDDE